MREDTQKTFKVTRKNLPMALGITIVFPAMVFLWSRQEEIVHDQRKESFNSPKDNKYL
jgi:hypothetical protein